MVLSERPGLERGTVSFSELEDWKTVAWLSSERFGQCRHSIPIKVNLESVYWPGLVSSHSPSRKITCFYISRLIIKNATHRRGHARVFGTCMPLDPIDPCNADGACANGKSSAWSPDRFPNDHFFHSNSKVCSMEYMASSPVV